MADKQINWVQYMPLWLFIPANSFTNPRSRNPRFTDPRFTNPVQSRFFETWHVNKSLKLTPKIDEGWRNNIYATCDNETLKFVSKRISRNLKQQLRCQAHQNQTSKTVAVEVRGNQRCLIVTSNKSQLNNLPYLYWLVSPLFNGCVPSTLLIAKVYVFLKLISHVFVMI